MENMNSFWQLGDQLRVQSRVSEDHKWLMAASRLAEQTKFKGDRMNNLDPSKGQSEMRLSEKVGLQEDNKFESLNFNMLSLDPFVPENVGKGSFKNAVYNMNAAYEKSAMNSMGNLSISKYSANNVASKESHNSSNNSNNHEINNAVDKRFKTLPATETLPRNEVLGGYIFVCNNETMQEDLKRQLFGN